MRVSVRLAPTPEAAAPMSPSLLLSPASSIDEVLDRLDGLIDEFVRDGSRMALFACLYRSVTSRVRDGIRSGRFDDGPRMERFDVIFANRYLNALAAYRRGESPGRSWRVAFDGTRSGQLLILQHLLLGMNAHINYDLGVAAAQTAPGAALPGLRRDFFEITRLLGELLEEVQDRITRVSPWLGVIDVVGCRTDEEVFFFGLSRARDVAWEVARCVADAPPERLPAELDRVDRVTEHLAGAIRRPALHLLPVLLCIRAREVGDVAAVVEALS